MNYNSNNIEVGTNCNYYDLIRRDAIMDSFKGEFNAIQDEGSRMHECKIAQLGIAKNYVDFARKQSKRREWK